MRAGGGKQKGGAFERWCCKRLSEWISKGTRDDIFWRSAMSGGRASVQFKKGKKNQTQCGDISAIDPIGSPFCNAFFVECKHVSDLHIEGLLKDAKSGLNEFWEVASSEADKTGQFPLIIAKSRTIKPIACISTDGAKYLTVDEHLSFGLFFIGRYMLMYDLEGFLTQAEMPTYHTSG